MVRTCGNGTNEDYTQSTSSSRRGLYGDIFLRSSSQREKQRKLFESHYLWTKISSEEIFRSNLGDWLEDGETEN